MLSNDELVWAIYKGKCYKVEQDFVDQDDSPSCLMLNMNCLQKDRPDGEYTIDFVSLILMGDAYCSSQARKFWAYAHLLDWVIKKDGLRKVVYLTKHPHYTYDTKKIRLVKGGQIQPGVTERVDISVSNEMAIFLQNLEKRCIAESIYNGDFDTFEELMLPEAQEKRFFSEMNFDIVHLMKQPDQKEFFMQKCDVSLVPLILKGEADHPGNFLKYKKILDFVATHDGVQRVAFSAKNPVLTQTFPGLTSREIRQVEIPVSEQTQTYLKEMEKASSVPSKRPLTFKSNYSL